MHVIQNKLQVRFSVQRYNIPSSVAYLGFHEEGGGGGANFRAKGGKLCFSYICITFCRVRHNIRSIIILLTMASS